MPNIRICYWYFIPLCLFIMLLNAPAQDNNPFKVLDPYHGLTSERMVWMEYTDVHNAVSIVGLRAADVNRLARYLQQRFPARPLVGASRGHFNTVLLHATAMNPQIKVLVMFEPLLSYESMVMNKYYSMKNLYAAPSGVMSVYDLQDLSACLAPRPMVMVNPLDQQNKPATVDDINRTYRFTRVVYQQAEAGDQLLIQNDFDTKAFEAMVAGWLD